MYVTLMTSDRYFGGKRLAPQDRLGSAGDFYPWGEAKGGNNPPDTWSYATYWRDSASGLDYANNRYYSNAYGRFMTPDPYRAIATSSSDPASPQSWNRYSYVEDDPVNANDPRGLLPCYNCPNADGDGVNDGGYGDCFTAAECEDPTGYCPPSESTCDSVPLQPLPTSGGDNFVPAPTRDETDAYNDLFKNNCFTLLGFTTASDATSWFRNHIRFFDVQKGKLVVQNNAPADGTPPPSDTSTYGAIYINIDYNWEDFSKNPTSTGGVYDYLGYLNKVYGTNMNSEQLGTFLILHELLHNRPSDVAETVKAGQTIINDCLK